MILPWFKRDFMMWCPSSLSRLSFSWTRSLRYSTLSASHIVSWPCEVVVTQMFCPIKRAVSGPACPGTRETSSSLLPPPSLLQRPARSVPHLHHLQPPTSGNGHLTIPEADMWGQRSQSGGSNMFIHQSAECKQLNGVYLNFTQILLNVKRTKIPGRVYKHLNRKRNS